MKLSGYGYVFTMGMQKAMAYRADFFLGLFSCLFPIIMQVYLWSALYAAGAANANGYTYEQMILYTLLAGVTARIVAAGFENEVAGDIKDGGLSRYLIRPVSYSGYCFARFLGSKAADIGLLLAVTAAVLAGSARVLGVPFPPVRLGLYGLSLVGALALSFSIFYTVALLGFWLTEIRQLFGTISIVIMVVSGGVFPLDIFGPAAAAAVQVLPFGYTTQFCVNIVNGRLDFGMPLPDVLCGLALIVYGWQREGLPVTFANLAGFVVFCIAGWFLTYCLFLIPELLSFWFVAAGGAQALSSAVFDFNNTPMNLYPKWLQRVGIFLVPVFLITNFPTLFVMGALSPALIAWGLAAPWLVFALQRLIWRRAMRRYTSASG